MAHINNNLQDKRKLQKEINHLVKQCKKNYARKIEHKFGKGDHKSAWEGLKVITGFGVRNKSEIPQGDLNLFVNGLNQFYGRFDRNNSTNGDENHTKLCMELGSQGKASERIVLTTGQVEKSLKSIRTNKSAGPDGIRGKILKECHKELAGVFQRLFQWSLDTYTIPSLWKSSTVIPIPKILKPAVLNDYRPVALTPIVMKCFERVIKGILLTETRNAADPFQFAYRAHRGVDDAIMTLLHNIYGHIDNCKSYVRTLFIDFSSAFNTIRPQSLLYKLQHCKFVS